MKTGHMGVINPVKNKHNAIHQTIFHFEILQIKNLTRFASKTITDVSIGFQKTKE